MRPTTEETVHAITGALRDYKRALATADATQRTTEVADLADRAADLLEAHAKYYRSRAALWRPTHDDVTGEEC